MELKEIKILRKKFGISQSDLAKLADVSQSLIAKIEAGRIDPTFTKTQKIFGALEKLGKQKEMKAEEVMNKKIISLKSDDSVKDAISKMKKYDISQLPIIDNNNVLGMVSEAILLDVLLKGKKVTKIKEVMEDLPPIISKDASVKVVSQLLKHFPFVMVSSKGKLMGVITKSDMIRNLA